MDDSPTIPFSDEQSGNEVLLARITSLEEEAATNLNGWKRAQADYQNLKKDIEEQQKIRSQYIQEDIIERFLPALENLHRAIAHAGDDPAVYPALKQGVRAVDKQFQEVLSQLGVVAIGDEGELFDPRIHEAIENMDTSENGVEGNILVVSRVVSKGYTMHGRVIRPARVVVSRAEKQNDSSG